MGIKFRRRINLDANLKDIRGNLSRALESALSDEVLEIQERTRSGKTVDGKAFERYSKGYEKYKTQRGRNQRPDLTFTGNMLASITTTVKQVGDKIRGQIFFSSAKEAAKAGFNQTLRPFFGLSEKQVKRITQRLKEALKK